MTGDYSEMVVFYWLSKCGFECVKVDYTGIDLLARKPDSDEIWGISVKSRSRATGKRGDSMNIERENFTKTEAACDTFRCLPYFGIVVDEEEKTYAFLLSMGELKKLFPKGERVCVSKMSEAYIQQYKKNPNIQIIELTHDTDRWFPDP
jgi:hypothetical protein